MKATTRIALIFSGLYILTKLIFYYGGWHDDNHEYIMVVNLLLIVLCVWLSIRTTEGNPEVTRGIDELKAGMRGLAQYAIILAAFTFVFYEFIHPEFLTNRIDERVANTVEMISDPTKARPSMLTNAEVLEREKSTAQLMFSPLTQSTFTVMVVLLIGFLYTVLMVFFRRKIAPRLRELVKE